MTELMDVFVVTCLSSLELTIERRARDLGPGSRRSNFCGRRPRSPFSPQAVPPSRTDPPSFPPGPSIVAAAANPVCSWPSTGRSRHDLARLSHLTRSLINAAGYGATGPSVRAGLASANWKLPFLNSDLRRLSPPVATMPPGTGIPSSV